MIRAITVPPAETMTPRPYTLIEKVWETPDTATLVFENPEQSETHFEPGQFMMIYVFGVGEVPISIAGNPHMGHFLVHTVRAVGAVTDAIVALEPGDNVGMRGPFGSSWPVTTASGRDLLVIAGGIGLAPLRPAILEGLHRREDLESLSLLYGARSPTDLLYRGDLLGWISTDGIQVEVTVDRAGSDWWGDVGLVTDLLFRVPFDPANATAFVCGPEVMMRVVARELRDSGVAADDIWMSVERNMKCAVGFCGHCQYGSDFMCKTGPVGTFAHFADRLRVSDI
ncbi:MAG: FAD/NAD(P)-binding protein [Acidimicrobiia bacterium]|jgi:NAD(P)H-flavin reductase